MDILDILLDDEESDTASVKVEAGADPVDDTDQDLELLLEEFKSSDTKTSKAALQAMLALMK